ncbi:hypothetical protein LTR53_014355 [Teratosphaeriaceae sp. CCFEE 6253]|nr:hypothetical protein LTR53_014355 [Teratosphaeriaceae sp. CCFEE 6253]
MDAEHDRISIEVSLLESMYPDQMQYNAKAREVKYASTAGSFVLRLPTGYLQDELPEVLSASAGRVDLREPLKKQIEACAVGEEVLDSIISAFGDLAEEADHAMAERVAKGDSVPNSKAAQAQSHATIVVWLHHLLNTNKRKLALSPASPHVSGVTKPGYPGVLIYSGPAEAVHEHVNELKRQNWQAFQVRLEDDEPWGFAHGTGVIEVEAMKEVVAEIGGARKDLFMEAMRMK